MTRPPDDAGAPTHANDTLADEEAARAISIIPEEGLIAGRYRILAVIGNGGMGVVYQVLDQELDEIVALKKLRRSRLDRVKDQERFRQEVRLARRVTHRNVARTFDIGEHGADPFLTMEYVEGTSLAQRLDERGRLTIAETVRIAIEIGEALEAAHASGVVHRDLKPDNVLLCPGGRIVVTDFGVARALAADVESDRGELLIGTPAYMAPEQVEGGDHDGRVDLYALGLLLYEMLTGEQPFSKATPLATAAARLTQPAPDLRVLRPHASQELADLVASLLAREPNRRPENATQALALLRAITAPPSGDERQRPPTAPSSLDVTLAIKPLENRGSDGDDWVAEGVTDELVDKLCVVRGLRVKSKTPALSAEDTIGFGRRMGVELVVDGSTRVTDDRVSLRLRLTSVQDGFQVWANEYKSPVGELLDRVQKAATQLAQAAGRAAPEVERAVDAGDPAAVELYLRTFQTKERFRADPLSWLKSLVDARKELPNHPRVVSAYAVGHALVGAQPAVPSAPLMEKAREAAERALELAPHLAEPWVALARVRFGSNDTKGAIRAVGRAVRNGPSLPAANDLLGRIFAEIDRAEEARDFLRRAIWLDDGLAFARVDLARVEALAGHWEEARELTMQIYERSSSAYGTIGPRLAVWLGAPLGPEAAVPPNPSIARLIAPYIRIAAGVELDDEDWKSLDDTIRLVPPSSRMARLLGQIEAELRTRIGDLDGAFFWIRKSVSAGLEDIGWLERCPLLEPLHGDPRYEELRVQVRRRADSVWEAWEQSWSATTSSLGEAP